jgi:hypothetical protein
VGIVVLGPSIERCSGMVQHRITVDEDDGTSGPSSRHSSTSRAQSGQPGRSG